MRAGALIFGTPDEKQAREVPVRIVMVKNSRNGGGRVARATCVYHGREIMVEVPTKGEADIVAIHLAFEEVKRQAKATTEDVMSGGTAWKQAFGRAKTWVKNVWGGA